jgi:hypothetical protein
MGEKNTIVHEMVHYLDPGLEKQAGSIGHVGQDDRYYNSPGEWNTFWQEGAARLEAVLRRTISSTDAERKYYFGDGSLAALIDRVHHFWDLDFLRSLNPEYRRKFDKRMAQLWTGLKKKGLL